MVAIHRPRGKARLLTIGVLGALLLVSLPAAAAPPSNDNFANATPTAQVGVHTQSTADATMEAGEPAPCGLIGSTVWFRFTALVPGLVTIDSQGSNYDTVLAAYAGAAYGSLTLKACNDDAAGLGLQSRIAFPVAAGDVVSVQAGGYLGGAGNLVMKIVPGAATIPNDQRAGAISIPARPFTLAEPTVGATTEAGEPLPCGAMGSTVWFRLGFADTQPGLVTVDTRTAVPMVSNYDTVLAAYRQNADGTLTNLACNDDAPGLGLQSSITFPVASGETILLQAGGFFGSQGALGLDVA